MPGLYAALDLGSNTFRLILGRALPDGSGLDPASKRVWQEIPRISEGLRPGEAFRPGPLARAWRALDGFAGTVGRERPERVLAGATMAARIASDGEAFAEGLRSRYGWEAVILQGREEARLSALGALAGFPRPPESSVVFDVGGRSTEFALARGGDILGLRSLPLGVVALREANISHDPPLPAELAALEAEVRAKLADAPLPGDGPPPVLVGTAGTVTTLAAMLLGLPEYLPERVHGAEIARGPVERLYRELALETSARMAETRPSLHPMRADVITGGLALVLGILDRYGAPGLVASDWGLLEGLWLACAGAAGPAAGA